MTTVILCIFAFAAGFVDSVAGGGGLIQLPALLLFLPPGCGTAAALGTNKLSSICGTGMAVVQYGRRIEMVWRMLLPAAGAALVFSWFGARAAVHLKPEVLRPLVLAMMVLVAGYTFLKPDFGSLHAPRLTPGKEGVYGLVLGVGIGFYDGFFGPGTGSFLVFALIGVFGYDFLRASAGAKAINFATNLSAVAYFASTGSVLYRYAVPMAVCNMAGSVLGSRLAIGKGSRFVRRLFLAIVVLLIARFGWEVFKPERTQ